MSLTIDPETLGHACNGEVTALCSLARSSRPHIEKQLARYPFTDEDREDVVQATLMHVIRGVGSFRGNASFSTWLFRVTANEALMLMRTQRRQRARIELGLADDEIATPDTGPPTDAGVANAERERCVRDAVAELPADYRELVLAYYHLDLGLQEIAQRFALTESAVRSRLHRARAQLRALLVSYADLAA